MACVFDSSVCLHSATEERAPKTILTNVTICADCTNDYFVPMFEATLQSESNYPVKWGPTPIPTSDFRDVLGEAFVQRYEQRVAEYRIPLADRQTTQPSQDVFDGLVRGKDYQLCPNTSCRCPFCFICGESARETSGHWDRDRPCPRYWQPDAHNAIHDVPARSEDESTLHTPPTTDQQREEHARHRAAMENEVNANSELVSGFPASSTTLARLVTLLAEARMIVLETRSTSPTLDPLHVREEFDDIWQQIGVCLDAPPLLDSLRDSVPLVVNAAYAHRGMATAFVGEIDEEISDRQEEWLLYGSPRTDDQCQADAQLFDSWAREISRHWQEVNHSGLDGEHLHHIATALRQNLELMLSLRDNRVDGWEPDGISNTFSTNHGKIMDLVGEGGVIRYESLGWQTPHLFAALDAYHHTDFEFLHELSPERWNARMVARTVQ